MANHKIAEMPSCCFRCSVCSEPDCVYDGDYVTTKEIRAASKRDSLAIWYGKSWREIESQNKENIRAIKERARKKVEKMNRTETGNIDLSIVEAYKFMTMGYILVIENGEIKEVRKEE